jgi:hypothetical protein
VFRILGSGLKVWGLVLWVKGIIKILGSGLGLGFET